jgi:hypothetical protein
MAHRTDDGVDPASAEAVANSAFDLICESVEAATPDDLELGIAYVSRFIDAAELRHSAPDPDVEQLLSDAYAVTFPVKHGDDVVSSVTVAPTPDGAWKIQSVGSANQVKAIGKIRDQDAARSGRDPASYFVLTIPALKMFLVGHRDEEGVLVSQVFDNDRLGLRAGEWEPASDVLRMAMRTMNAQADGAGG